MKTLNKILLILSLALCLGGGLLLAIGAWAGGIDDAQELADTRIQHYDQEKTLLDDFTALDVDLAMCSMEIRPSDDAHAYIEYHIESITDSKPPHVTVQNDKLQIRDTSYMVSRSNVEQILTGFLWLLPNVERESYANGGNIILYLPQTTFNNVQLALDMGDLSINGLQASQLTADIAMGSLDLTNTTFGQCNIDLDMGTLTGEGLTFNGDATVEVNMGNAELALSPESSTGLLIDANTDMGAITAPNNWGGNLLDTDDVVANHYRRTPQGTSTGSLTITADMGEIIFR